MVRIPAFRVSARCFVALLFLMLALLLSAACGGVETAAPPAPTTIPPTATPGETPTAQPATPEPTVIPPGIVGIESESNWRPPTIEDTILTNQATGGELPADLHEFMATAQATVGNSGIPGAIVHYYDNGLSGDSYRAAFPLRHQNGTWYWTVGSAFPSQMGLDGTISPGEYYEVPGSQDARLEWNPGIDDEAETEPTLVKHRATLPDGTEAALLYWHPLDRVWKPVEGYQAAQEFVAVGDTIYQFSPVDGSAVEVGVVPGFEAMTTANGRVEFVGADGEVYWLGEDGRVMAAAHELYSHITTAPDGTALQEYLNTSGARVEPAIHLGEGAYELVPAGAVLPTHIYEPETGWLAVDPDKALIDRVSTSTWFTARGSAGTIYEGLEMPIRVTTTDLLTLREVSYSAEAQEFYMVYWLRMSHLAHKFQNAGNTVDFETWLNMLRSGDEKALIYVYSYNLNPDGTRGGLRSQWVDPRKGVTIQLVYDRAFERHPLATVTNPNNAQPGLAFILGATEAGQAAIAVNTDADWLDAATSESKGDRLTSIAIADPLMAMQWVASHATSHAMQNPDANTPGFVLSTKDVNIATDAALDYLREQLGIEPEYPHRNLGEVSYD